MSVHGRKDCYTCTKEINIWHWQKRWRAVVRSNCKPFNRIDYGFKACITKNGLRLSFLYCLRKPKNVRNFVRRIKIRRKRSSNMYEQKDDNAHTIHPVRVDKKLMPDDVKDDLQATPAKTDYPSAEGNLSPSRVRTIRRIQANVVTLDRDLAETQINLESTMSSSRHTVRMENKLKLQNGSHNDLVSFLESTLNELRNVSQKLKNNTVPDLMMETNGRIGWLTNVKRWRMKMSCSKMKLRIESQPNAPCSSFITRSITMRGGYQPSRNFS